MKRVTAKDETARFLHFVIQQSCTRYSSTLLWAIHRILITVQVQTRSATQQLTQNEKQLIGSHSSPTCLDLFPHDHGDASRPVWPLALIKVTFMHLLPPWKSNALYSWTHISMDYPKQTDNAKLTSSSNMFLQESVHFIMPTYLSDEALWPILGSPVSYADLWFFSGCYNCPPPTFTDLLQRPQPFSSDRMWPWKDISQLCLDFWKLLFRYHGSVWVNFSQKNPPLILSAVVFFHEPSHETQSLLRPGLDCHWTIQHYVHGPTFSDNGRNYFCCLHFPERLPWDVQLSPDHPTR